MKTLYIILVFVVLPFIVDAQNSHIQVVAEPGISVFLDGQFKGVTSSDYGGLIIQNVSAGHHEIKVVKDGYSPREESINVKEGEVLQYKIDKILIPAIRISEEGNKEKQAISIRTGNLTVQSLPISIRIQIPDVKIDFVKSEDKFHADNIPEGTYLAQFLWNDKVLPDTISILNGMETYLFVNMVELKTENIDYKQIYASKYAEEERRLNQIQDRTTNAFGNAGNVGENRTSEGVAGGEGNRGIETGNVGVRMYGPGGSAGNGSVSYKLEDRKFQSLPVPEYNYKGEGVVIVEISIDREGNVIKADAGVKGSTTLDPYLLRVAREAAMKAKFDKSDDAPLLQKRTITYIFRLK